MQHAHGILYALCTDAMDYTTNATWPRHMCISHWQTPVLRCLNCHRALLVCHKQAGQLLALRALQEGRSWVTDKVKQLQGNR